MKNLKPKPATPEQIAFYCVMGQALYSVQELECALSHSITLKKHYAISKQLAEKALIEHHEGYTLGQAIKLSQKENLYPSRLQKYLSEFNQKRNWLIHKAIFETRGDLYLDPKKHNLFQKLKAISDEAQKLQHEIELDLVDFCASKGKNMPNVRALINENYC